MIRERNAMEFCYQEDNTEIWRPVKGYEGLYEISNEGRVRSVKFGKEKMLKLRKTSNGYLQVGLCKDGKHKSMFVHRLVAEAFIPNPQGLETVNHKDEDKTNNSASNLEWMTRGDNIIYSKARPVQMLDKSTGKLLVTFPSIHEARRVTEISQGNICTCCNGKCKSAGGYKWRYA